MRLVRDRAYEFGARGIDPTQIWFDLAAAVARKDKIVQDIVDGIYGWIKPNDHITFLRGQAHRFAAEDVLYAAGRTVDYRVVPRAVFTQPALAGVGLTEAEALAAGYEVKVGTALFAHSGRAKAIGETEGMLKFIADAETGELLGGHILGPHADILIHEVVTAMYNKGTAESLCKSIHIHPTLSEMVKDAARKLR